jgi:hypothetical protein
MNEIDDQDGPTFNQLLARRMEREISEFEKDARAKQQAVLDRWWETKLALESLDDGFDYSTGFRESRRRTTCHKGRGDPDYGI